jgi:hypothetical protein
MEIHANSGRRLLLGHNVAILDNFSVKLVRFSIKFSDFLRIVDSNRLQIG